MATVKMRKIRITATKPEQKPILELLSRSGCFEVSAVTDGELLALDGQNSVPIETETVLTDISKLSFAIEYSEQLRDEAKELNKAFIKSIKKAKQKKPLVIPYDIRKEKPSLARVEKSHNDYSDAVNRSGEILSAAEKLSAISLERAELRSKLKNVTALKRKVEPFLGVDAAFSEFNKDTAYTSSMLMIGPKGVKDGGFYDIEAYISDFPSTENRVIGVICKKPDKIAVLEKLAFAGFTTAGFNDNKTAKELIDGYELESASIEAKITDKLSEAFIIAEERISDFKVLYDVFSLDLEKADAESGFLKTQKTFTLDGWMPELLAGDVIGELKKFTDKICIEDRAPIEGDEPPTYLYNAKLIKPFEPITENYSPPAYGELDPNPVMAFFFFIFFGIMLGDAGYGAILAIGCFVILKVIRLEKGFKQMIAMFGLCGISAVIFGIVFGGVFAISAVPPLWFNPLEEPLMLLVVAIVLGVLQLSAGYTMKMAKKLSEAKAVAKSKKERFLKTFDGIFDALFIYLLFIGIAFLVMPMLFASSSFPFAKVGMGLLIASLVGILLTNGRGAFKGKGSIGKKIGGYISGGLGGLYNLISLFSDVLSYLRIFGLALSGAAIGMAFNMIGSMLFGIPVVGYVIGALVLAVLHAFNFALSALGAYVHNIRLQYLEFYGKFFDGEGRLFSPLGQNTKYVRFMEK